MLRGYGVEKDKWVADDSPNLRKSAWERRKPVANNTFLICPAFIVVVNRLTGWPSFDISSDNAPLHLSPTRCVNLFPFPFCRFVLHSYLSSTSFLCEALLLLLLLCPTHFPFPEARNIWHYLLILFDIKECSVCCPIALFIHSTALGGISS